MDGLRHTSPLLPFSAFRSFIHTSQPPPDLYEQTGFDSRYAGCGLRLFLGLFTGIFLSLVYAAIAVVSVLFGTGARTLEQSGLTLGNTISLYFLAGGVAGTVGGSS